MVAAEAPDAHRPLGQKHDLASILSRVEQRQVQRDYTVHFQGRMYRIERSEVVPGLRSATVRVEQRLDGSLALAFHGRFLRFQECVLPEKRAVQQPAVQTARPRPVPPPGSGRAWARSWDRMPDIPIWKAAKARG